MIGIGISPFNKKGSGGSIIGTLFTDTFLRGSLGANWTLTGAPTATLDGSGDLTLGGGACTLAKYITCTAYATDFENVDVVIPFMLDSAPGASNCGLTVAFASAAAIDNRRVQFLMSFVTGTVGKLYFYYNDVLVTTGGNTMAALQNDEIILTISRRGLTYNASAYNQRTAETTTVSFTASLSYVQTRFTHLTSYLRLYAGGGQQKIHSVTISTPEVTQYGIEWFGDSIMSGLYSGGISARYADIVSTNLARTKIVRAGPSDMIADAIISINKGNEYAKFRANKTVIHLGTNDVNVGVSAATIQTNYQTLISTLVANGRTLSNIYHCKALPRGGLAGIATWNAWLVTTYGANVIDTYTDFDNGSGSLNVTYNSGDNVHPNVAGQLKLATLIQPYL